MFTCYISARGVVHVPTGHGIPFGMVFLGLGVLLDIWARFVCDCAYQRFLPSVCIFSVRALGKEYSAGPLIRNTLVRN